MPPPMGCSILQKTNYLPVHLFLTRLLYPAGFYVGRFLAVVLSMTAKKILRVSACSVREGFSIVAVWRMPINQGEYKIGQEIGSRKMIGS
jgi:hypothetical protein